MRAVTWPGTAGLLIVLLLSGGPVLAGEKLKLASGQAKARSYAAAVGLSSLIKFELLPREKIDMQVLESSRTIDNVRLLQKADAELAILPSAIGHAARLGTGSFAGQAPATNFRAIATLWRDALHMVVRADDATTGTISDLSELKDRKVFLGEPGSGMIDANRLLFSDLDIDADQAFELATVADGDGISAIKRGDVDAFSAMVRPPEAMFEDVFNDKTTGLRLLDVTEAQMNKANGNHWLWTPYIIPADTYPNQNDDIRTIALSTLLVVRTDIDDDVVYAITKSIFENLDYLKRVDPSMADLSLEHALAGMAMPLHPGALRYYDDAGLIPKTTSEGDATSPMPMPVGQDHEQPGAAPVERYPDADVAGNWPLGAGGPLLRTSPSTTAVKGRDHPSPTAGGRPANIQERSEPHWRRRVTF